MLNRNQMEALDRFAKSHDMTLADLIWLIMDKIEWLQQFGIKTYDDPEWRND